MDLFVRRIKDVSPFFSFFTGMTYCSSSSEEEEEEEDDLAALGAQPSSLRCLVMSSMSSESLGGR